ncbi:putative asparagine synthase [Mycena olivaceomarginata]|nr:putative asparagine synthase [Mycena olivaceomarginata]
MILIPRCASDVRSHLCLLSDGVDPPSLDALEHGLDASLETIKYRGPDSRGTYISPDRRAGLGHVRLSIIDLPTGQQPLSDEENSIHCVVTSKSDSELVVQLYKRDGFNLLFSLRGEFAFVLYDVKRQLVFAARDRFGIKPLYYTVSNGSILFGSEIKAFMGLGWQAEWDIECIVNHGDLCDERTVFKRVKKVPARGLLRRLSRLGRHRNPIVLGSVLLIRHDISFDISGLDDFYNTDHLVEAVRLRLRSDVPLAVYLSGGIDSSAIAGIATHLLREKDPSAKLTAFTLAYVGRDHRRVAPGWSDRSTSRSQPHQVDATEARLVGVLEESIWHSEFINNTFHGAGKLLLSKAVHDAGYKVALSGEGSDELFGGYPWFPLDYLRSPDPAAATLGIPLPSEAERHALSEEYQAATGMAQLPPNAMSLHKSEGPRHMLNISAHLALGAFWTPDAKTFRTEVVQHVGGPDLPRAMEEGIDMRVRQKSVSGEWHSLHVALYFVAKTLMGRGILNLTGDRNDMANSIESRVAFLDHHLVEYVNSLPPSVKMRPIPGDAPGKWTLVEKWILRQAVQPFITEEVFLRKKVQFNPPPSPAPGVVSDLLPLQVHLKARITEASVERLGFVEWPVVRDVLVEYLEAPTFPAQGGIDAKARVLMTVLSYIVLQERFNVPSYRV